MPVGRVVKWVSASAQGIASMPVPMDENSYGRVAEIIEEGDKCRPRAHLELVFV